jgi:hypothetical protein
MNPGVPRIFALSRLCEPVDGASLALFRVLTGLLVLTSLFYDWPRLDQMIRAEFHFTYYGFGWLEALPRIGLYWLHGVIALAAGLVILGLAYRVAAPVLFLSLLYVFLLEQARYSNNGYLLILSTLLLSLLPVNRVWALDNRLLKPEAGPWVPRWAPLSVAALAAVPLLYMGLTRLNSDWLAGYPLTLWFKAAAGGHWLGPRLAGVLASNGFALGWSWFVLALYLAIVPMLLWRRTRLPALLLFVLCYVGYSVAFKRMIFPFPLFIAMLAFFPPDWPRRLRAALKLPAAIPAVPAAASALPAGPAQTAVMTTLAVFLAFHLLFPARGLVYPGITAWTGDGYRFAWRDMLDDKFCEAEYTVKDPVTGKTWIAAPHVEIAAFQLRELAVRPDMLPQFAKRLKTQWLHRHDVQNARVYAQIRCSLNSRPPQLLLDPKLDLTQVERSLGPAEWVTPGDKSLPRGWRRQSRR